MEVRILGHLEVLSDRGGPVPVRQPLIRSAICVLALTGDRPLSTARLGDLLAARGPGAVKTCVSGVRRVLTHDRVPLGHGGYRLRLGERDSLDLATFRDLLGQAREARDRGDGPLAAELYGRGLALWRDPPLADLPRTAATSGLVAGLLAERRQAREELAVAGLALGRHRELVPMLRAWVDDEPLHEHLWAQLLLALYRSGRRAEALHLYDDAHDTLVQATGAEPGPELQRMWHRVKVNDPGLAPAAAREQAPPAPAPLARQLPPGVRDFTGREAERDGIGALLASAATLDAPPIVHITGAPGVGKTSLALHAAHAAAASFPDGQLYLQLAGASSAPRDPAVVLNEVLRAVGVAPADIPDTLAERAAAYRSRLAGRRVLVLADDAADPDQIAPLLPGTPGAAIIVTGRSRSLNLDGAHLVDLAGLPPAEAVRMLGRIIGAARIDAERDDAGRLVAACDGLPLAVRIAGARLAARPSWPLAHLAGLLLDRSRRLDHLVAGNAAVRAHIEAGYDSLDERSRRAFRLLALAGPHDVAAWLVDVLLGGPAGDVVDTLVDKCLLDAAGVDRAGRPRYRMHDLIREYAGERLREDPGAEAALERLTLAWLELVDAADARVPRDPYFPAPARFTKRVVVDDGLVAELVGPGAAQWLDGELPNLRTAVEIACKAGRFRLATGLVLRLAAHLHLNHRHDDAEHLWRTVMEAASSCGDEAAAARCGYRAAMVIAADRGRPSDAFPLIDECTAVFESAHARPDLARALGLRAYCAQLLARLDDAERDAERGLALAREVRDGHAAFHCLRVLGLVLSQKGEHVRAADACERSLAIARDLGEAAYQGMTLYTLVRVHLTAGHYERVPKLCEEGLALTGSIGHRLGDAYFNEQWGYAHQGSGDHEAAVPLLLRAAELFSSQEAYAAGAKCRGRLAESYEALGLHAEARAQRTHPENSAS